MRVGMCDCDCVPVFLSGWVFGYPLSWIILGPPSNGRPICPCHTPCQWLVSLPAGVLVVLGARAWCSGMCRLTPSGCLAGPGPKAPCQGSARRCCALGSWVSWSMAGSPLA
ncbi:hypothetical protein ATANTOWER_022532 [Ataeniobius toweri]|uniref:Uncharacterized protein n=1 Tax=Ataeniobius toweri TaxID=208326 RepID=A0ABU7CBA2_9TELE|nr:hypothetical protein [Ataeniobius toweri]